MLNPQPQGLDQVEQPRVLIPQGYLTQQVLRLPFKEAPDLGVVVVQLLHQLFTWDAFCGVVARCSQEADPHRENPIAAVVSNVIPVFAMPAALCNRTEPAPGKPHIRQRTGGQPVGVFKDLADAASLRKRSLPELLIAQSIQGWQGCLPQLIDRVQVAGNDDYY